MKKVVKGVFTFFVGAGLVNVAAYPYLKDY
jgi:hypothetical protein